MSVRNRLNPLERRHICFILAYYIFQQYLFWIFVSSFASCRFASYFHHHLWIKGLTRFLCHKMMKWIFRLLQPRALFPPPHLLLFRALTGIPIYCTVQIAVEYVRHVKWAVCCTGHLKRQSRKLVNWSGLCQSQRCAGPTIYTFSTQLVLNIALASDCCQILHLVSTGCQIWHSGGIGTSLTSWQAC
jgi:hypothetical protein